MKNFEIARRQITVVFLVILFTFSIINARSQWVGMVGGFSWIIENTDHLHSLQRSFANFETFISENIIGRVKLVEFYALIQKLIGKNEIDNFYIFKDSKGMITYGEFEPEDLEGIGVERAARRVWRMQQTVADKGTEVFFVNPPALHVRSVREYPPGYPYRDVNYRLDGFLFWLGEYGVPYIDLRNTLARRKLPMEEYFYSTDHHWKTRTSFLGFGDIISWMNARFGAGLDEGGFYRDIENYHSKTYPNAFLGSMGRRSGILYSGLDDFEVIWPKFDTETDFTYESRFTEPERKDVKNGPFTKSLMYPPLIQTRTPYQTDFYSVYHSGIKSHEKIINNMNPDAPKLLMIRDSYSVPLGVFMAPLFSEIHMIWPVSGEIRLNIEEYLQENYFDYIMIELWETGLFVDNFYFFTEPLEDEELP